MQDENPVEKFISCHGGGVNHVFRMTKIACEKGILNLSIDLTCCVKLIQPSFNVKLGCIND